MDLGISGKVALVLGAGGGLGRAIAQSLAQAGARVAVCDIDAAALKETAGLITKAGLVAHDFVFDLSDLDALEQTVDAVQRTVGPIDILINNTGGPPPTKVSNLEPKAWRNSFEMMVLPVIRLTDLVIAGMCSRNWGRIITSASSGVITPIPNLGISNSLRSALMGWSKTLAREVARSGVTVNVVVPGRIATKRITQLDQARAQREGRSVEDVVAESTQTIPMGRYGRPEEYADAVTFLASQRASYITGSAIRIDGGLIPSI